MRICVICNHFFGFRAINYLMNYGLVTGIATTDLQPAVTNRLKSMAEADNLSFAVLKKESLSKKLKTWLRRSSPDVVFVFSFPYRIPEDVFSIPEFGFINFHPSILPSYRGPDPIFWQLKNDETETGVTAHKVEKDFDTGPLIRIEKEVIAENDTYGILTEKLSYTLVNCAGNVVNLLQESDDRKIFFDQDDESATYFGKPVEEDLKIRWREMRAKEILSLIKACNPNYEGAVTKFRDIPVRILGAVIDSENNDKIETGVIVDEDVNLRVAAVDYILVINIVYLQEGIFTGAQFREIFQVKAGERFQ